MAPIRPAKRRCLRSPRSTEETRRHQGTQSTKHSALFARVWGMKRNGGGCAIAMVELRLCGHRSAHLPWGSTAARPRTPTRPFTPHCRKPLAGDGMHLKLKCRSSQIEDPQATFIADLVWLTCSFRCCGGQDPKTGKNVVDRNAGAHIHVCTNGRGRHVQTPHFTPNPGGAKLPPKRGGAPCRIDGE